MLAWCQLVREGPKKGKKKCHMINELPLWIISLNLILVFDITFVF